MRLNMLVVLLVSPSIVAPSAAMGRQLQSPGPVCNVTTSNGVVAGSSERSRWSYGNKLLSVSGPPFHDAGWMVFDLDTPDFITRGGELATKFGWTLAIEGKLTVTGRRLDGDAPPLKADIRCCYGKQRRKGFQASRLSFSTPGCWEVVAQVADVAESKLTFVTQVVTRERPARLSPEK
jgi:hypothetical protein